MNLKEKTLAGLFWTFSQQFSVQLINFAVQVILARILLPAEFGLIGMLTIFISIGNSLIDSGLTSSLIRTPDASQRDYSTVFFINLAGSFIIYAILFASAPLIARFYQQDSLSAIIRVYTISFLLRAFIGVQTTRLTKEMNFRAQMFMQIPSVIGGGITGILLAYWGYGVWSLVWMNLVQAFLFTVQHWIFTGWRPSFIFDWDCFKYHFKFGYKLTLSGLLNAIYQNLYNLIIGKYFSATQLGYYTRAQTMQMFPVQNLSTALNKVTYPMFATIQEDDKRLKNVYRRLMQQVVFWVTPIMIVLVIIAEPLFRMLLTEKWLPAVPYFQVLCASGVLFPLHFYNLNILNVKGRSDLYFKLEIVKKAFTTVGVFCVIPFGIYGLLYFQVLSSVFAFVVNSWYSGRLIDFSLQDQLRELLPIFLLTILPGALSWALDRYLLQPLHAGDIARILTVGAAYFSLYLSMSYLTRMTVIIDLRQLVFKR
ncbi:MAG TPA: lipopolysaccharide biosynthesis protein [Chitinophaga sp.]